MIRAKTELAADRRLADIRANPGASFWLKQACDALAKRDPIDAARDAALLAAIFEQRAREITGGY